MFSTVEYYIDTSSILHGWRRAYPPDIVTFRPIWKMFDKLIEQGRIGVSIEVLREIEKKDDEVAEWCGERKESFAVDVDLAVQGKLKVILDKFPRMVMKKGTRNAADPFVIATALRKEPACIVVSEEEDDGSERNPKIPFVCDEMNVQWINLVELIRREI